MSNLIPGNQKHLSQTDREYIKTTLDSNTSFKDIAKFLCIVALLPNQVSLETLGEETLHLLKLKPIDPDKVQLTPKLIKYTLQS